MSHRLPFVLLVAVGMFGGAFLWAAQQSDVIVNPLAGNPVAIQNGARLFDQICAQCHGNGAVGDARAPALNLGTFSHGGGDADIFKTIRQGVPGTEMDAYRDYTDDEVWQLVAYIKSLAPPPPARGTAAACGGACAGNAAAG
jgi:mono/diheme cytochrome c family protein